MYSQGKRHADVSFPNNSIDASNRELLTLDGARLVPSIEVLNASRNRLSNFFGLVPLPRMRCLYVDSNSISSFAGLSVQPGLEILSMEENPICQHPMFRIMALLCAGESLRIINHKAVSEAERSLCQRFGGTGSSAARLISLGWTGLERQPKPQSFYSEALGEAHRSYDSQIKEVYHAGASDLMLSFSLQSFVELMRVEEGIAGFAAGAGSSDLPKERSQHGAYGMALGTQGVILTGDDDLPPQDAVLGLRNHLYGVPPSQRTPLKRPPWDFTPAPVPEGPHFAHERRAMDADSYNANDYDLPRGADRGGPARRIPEGRDLYSSSHHGHAPSAAHYQEEVDRAVAIDTARTFLNRVKVGGSTASLSVPLDPRSQHVPRAELESPSRGPELDESIVRAWAGFHRKERSFQATNGSFGSSSNADLAPLAAFPQPPNESNIQKSPRRTDPNAEDETLRNVQHLSARLFNGTVLSPLRVMAREHESRCLAKAARSNMRSVTASEIKALNSEGPECAFALALSPSEAHSLSNITLGPVHIYTSVPHQNGPVESVRGVMLGVNLKRSLLAIAAAGNEKGAPRVIAEIPFGDVVSIDVDSVSGGVLFSRAEFVRGSASEGDSQPTVRVMLEGGAKMDIVPTNAADRVHIARAIFKSLTMAKYCSTDARHSL